MLTVWFRGDMPDQIDCPEANIFYFMYPCERELPCRQAEYGYRLTKLRYWNHIGDIDRDVYTVSEYLVRGIQVGIAEGWLSAYEFQLYYNGKRYTVNERGEFYELLDFFSTSFDWARKLARANSKEE